MAQMASVVLLVYATLMLVGGFMGYRTAGSRASLIAGVASAVVLFAAWFWSRSSPTAGFVAGAVTALALTAVFGMRFAKTGSFMPSGMLLIVSIAALAILAVAVFRG